METWHRGWARFGSGSGVGAIATCRVYGAWPCEHMRQWAAAEGGAGLKLFGLDGTCRERKVEQESGIARSHTCKDPRTQVLTDQMLILFSTPTPTPTPAPTPPPAQDLDEEQVLVARLLHHLRSDDPDTHFAILGAVRQQLLVGGPLRMRTTLPALVFCGLALHRRIAERAGVGSSSSSSSGGSKGQVDGGKQEEEGEKQEQEGEEDGEGEGQEAKGKEEEGSGKAAAKEADAPPKVSWGARERGGGRRVGWGNKVLATRGGGSGSSKGVR